jgi:hypothetical protein
MSGSSPALPCASAGASAAHEPGGHSWRTVFTEPTRRNLGRETVGFLPECRRSALSSARATGCASHGALLFFARAKKSKQEKARPCIQPCATRRVRSLPRRFRGRLTRAIHGPLSGDASVLSPHPCGSSPYATSPLSLLTGNRVLPASPRMDKRTPVRRSVGWKTAQHFPPLATSKFSPGRGVLLFKPVGKLRVTHPADFAPLHAESIRPSFASPVSPHSRKQAKRFASLASYPPDDSVPNPLQEAERRCCAGGREAGRRARSEGTGTPFATAPGVTPEGGELCAAKPGCRGGLLFGYFFLATQEKVTRRARRNLQSQPRKAQRLTTLRTPPSTIQARILSKALCALRGATQSAATIPPSPNESQPPAPIGSGPPFASTPRQLTPPSRGDHP